LTRDAVDYKPAWYDQMAILGPRLSFTVSLLPDEQILPARLNVIR
jgi:hypothetical protein